MFRKIITLSLCSLTLAFADRIVIDNSMAAAERSDIHEYEDRGSFGPYIEFSNVSMGNVDYTYKVHNQKYNISVDNSYIYGASGTLPITGWFDIYVMAGYQFLGVSHHPANRDKVMKDFEALYEDYFGDSPISKSDIDGRHQIHTALFQLGFDLAYPLIASYNYQFMFKPYLFGAGIFGKTFFSDNTQFLSPVLYGYAYGAGLRIAWHGAYISTGLKNSYETFHTNFERKTSKDKSGDEFKLELNSNFQPFLSFGITLF
ncbi:hypothetical protein SAMN05720766_11111 [Fibrobacter sp. UWH9]|uniref:hypothetical protein n=1 Tax=unclassified Fibrobacter TaxID=2634177 RepID=UPI0009244937|nr:MULTISPECIES: hypothetical protein [Fibrobacter]MCQ2099342.1 hypothetical protein [Fibrobacter sp.]MCL4102402.1 hypothetical protein [Fibrobacter succinogenes]MDO4947084.1 hypothetical protein [Fibrobacter sp.]OWV17033.1 hypothetical protein B7992_01925 [Fibrobacter sp. UWH1]SHH37030.1 hypothetical protein SAMN05720766_11111 [Fibrobacter sp. UWH9]